MEISSNLFTNFAVQVLKIKADQEIVLCLRKSSVDQEDQHEGEAERTERTAPTVTFSPANNAKKQMKEVDSRWTQEGHSWKQKRSQTSRMNMKHVSNDNETHSGDKQKIQKLAPSGRSSTMALVKYYIYITADFRITDLFKVTTLESENRVLCPIPMKTLTKML